MRAEQLFGRVADLVPESAKGVARIEHFEITPEVAQFDALRSALAGGRMRILPMQPGRYCRLLVGGGLMMSDGPNERVTNIRPVTDTFGDVLVAGLGIGMIVGPIVRRTEVRSLTVVELHQDVIDLVEPYVRHPKLTVLQGDILTWKPPAGRKWDCIYFDIWPDASIPLDESTRLKRRFARRVRSGGWQRSWNEQQTRAFERRSR